MSLHQNTLRQKLSVCSVTYYQIFEFMPEMCLKFCVTNFVQNIPLRVYPTNSMCLYVCVHAAPDLEASDSLGEEQPHQDRGPVRAGEERLVGRY